jgi:hypothetical protein
MAADIYLLAHQVLKVVKIIHYYINFYIFTSELKNIFYLKIYYNNNNLFFKKFIFYFNILKRFKNIKNIK